ncbi:CubicO group peptidase (beta-lactamase class C family) [Kribbella sp. VKM Ac-2527]|uniref:CubicO group peptidase (Beta-lactamase class C family) n=1 Tax=Kribbella caucasensis TaxID=2512215 RepID=A0A4R6KL72_9ACTN|nr:serine hydrolase domain-containing protein [Kribbella sp. VKM Ac-2527]TDO49865.1 CubicO group peptidase (beta-lactamase class C family) [Kribbella sp. VKM Ac-2527]
MGMIRPALVLTALALIAPVACTSDDDGTVEPTAAPTVSGKPTAVPGTPTVRPQNRTPAPSTKALDPAKAAALQAVLAKVVKLNATIPDAYVAARGITAAVVTDKWMWSGAAGVDAAGTTLVPTTMLGAASITKTFVAAEVILLASAGKIDLDAPLSQYVRHRLTENDAPIRQHLAMRAGVPNFRPEEYAQLDKAIAAAPGKHWTAEEVLAYNTGPLLPPDSPYSYSNPSYLLLGLLIEKVTGQSLATVLRRDLARPAGLERAAFQDAEQPRPPLAEDRNPLCGKARDGFVPCRAFASSLGASASLAADAPTIARWGYQLYGGRVGPAELVRQMSLGEGNFGLGTMLFSYTFGNFLAFGHSGQLPDHTSMLVSVPELRLSVAVLVAAGGKDADELAGELIRAAVPLLDG